VGTISFSQGVASL